MCLLQFWIPIFFIFWLISLWLRLSSTKEIFCRDSISSVVFSSTRLFQSFLHWKCFKCHMLSVDVISYVSLISILRFNVCWDLWISIATSVKVILLISDNILSDVHFRTYSSNSILRDLSSLYLHIDTDQMQYYHTVIVTFSRQALWIVCFLMVCWIVIFVLNAFLSIFHSLSIESILFSLLRSSCVHLNCSDAYFLLRFAYLTFGLLTLYWLCML